MGVQMSSLFIMKCTVVHAQSCVDIPYTAKNLTGGY